MEFFTENLLTGGFLDKLDHTGIARQVDSRTPSVQLLTYIHARSKKETVRLHKLSKQPRVRSHNDELPSLDSHDENQGSSGYLMDDSNLNLSDNGNRDDEDDLSSSMHHEANSDEEQPYERKLRTRGGDWDSAAEHTMPRLPIKFPDGRVVGTAGRIIPQVESGSESEDNIRPFPEEVETHVVEDVSTGARFGRPAVADVVGTSSKQTRIQMAKEQIAGICQDILADPESSVRVCLYCSIVCGSHVEQLGLLRRLHTFSLAQIISPQTQTLILNDPVIRRLAMISQLAIFKDIIPGYRIRALSDTEKVEKVSQMVARTREWEQGLVSVYQTYLRSLESESKGSLCFIFNSTHADRLFP